VILEHAGWQGVVALLTLAGFGSMVVRWMSKGLHQKAD
jgi:hypothetical protein